MEIAQTVRLIVNKANPRLDKYICEECHQISRSYAQKLIKEGYVKVGGYAAKASLKLKVGDEITINFPPPAPSTLIPEVIPLDIVYEDSNLLIIDKPPGLTVHPAPGHPSHTLVNALLAHCPELAAIDSSVRPGIVHRLDKDTSGLMMVAKNKAAQLNLVAQLKSGGISKRYMVLVRGHIFPESGVIEAPIGRHPRNRKRMAVVPQGREARTHYRVLRYVDDYTLVEATLVTGRTHQIRVHFSWMGYPVVGDTVYGVKSLFLGRQFVHAYLLGLRLPSSGRWVEFKSELPPDLKQALERLSRTH